MSPPREQTLSPRERVRLALDHQRTDRVPIAMICSGFEGSTRDRLAEHLGLDPDRYLERYVDVAIVNEGYRGPSAQYRGPALERAPDGSYQDIWGVWRRPVSCGEGVYYEISRYPLSDVHDIADLEAHRWPDPDWWDYAALPDLIAQSTARRDYALCILSGNLFERTWWMRGYEQTLLDMIEQPELFHAIMTRVTDFFIHCTRRTLEAAKQPIEFAFTGDDIAWQQGLMMSAEMIAQHITPHHTRMNHAIHAYETNVMFHSDGAVMDAIPALLEAGIDVLQALQFDAAGMDPLVMKDRYGDRLCFEGGVSVQRTLPFGSAEEVQAEVRHLIRTLGRNGGYLLGPSHAIQPGTPPENIVAMFETAASTDLS